MKNNNLPEYWCVKNDGSQLFKDTVIKYLDEIDLDSEVNWLEVISDNNYYGFDGNKDNNGTNFWYKIEYFQNNPTLLTLEEFIELSIEQPIKILTYKRTQLTYHIHNTIVSNIIYIHDLKAVFYKETTGTFSGEKYGLCTVDAILLEAFEIYENKFINKDGLVISDIVFTELNDDKINYDFFKNLIEVSKKCKELKEQMEINIISLLDKIK